MEDFTQKLKEDKGKWVKWIGLAALLLILIIYINPILAFVTSLTKLLFLLGALLVSWLIVSSKPFRIMVSAIFEVLVRTVTVWFVELNPVAIANRFLRQALDRKAELQDQRGNLEGFIDELRSNQEKAKKERTKLLNEVDAATQELEEEKKKKKQDTKLMKDLDDNIGVWSQDVLRYNAEIEENQKFLEIVLDAQLNVDDLYRLCDVTIRNLQGEIRYLTQKFRMAGMFSGVMRNIKKILRGSNEEQQLYEDAARTIERKYSATLGDLKKFTSDMSGATLKLDLQNHAARTEVMNLLNALKGRKVANVTDQTEEPAKLGSSDEIDKLIKETDTDQLENK